MIIVLVWCLLLGWVLVMCIIVLCLWISEDISLNCSQQKWCSKNCFWENPHCINGNSKHLGGHWLLFTKVRGRDKLEYNEVWGWGEQKFTYFSCFLRRKEEIYIKEREREREVSVLVLTILVLQINHLIY